MVKTKILATLGPASWGKIDELVKAGVDGFRINMPHVGSYDETDEMIKGIRTQYPHLFIVADLEGPKIRLGHFNKFSVKPYQRIRISPENTYYPENKYPPENIPVRMNELYKYVQPGNILLIDDGKVGLKVTDIKDKTIIAAVEYGEEIESRKGINVPGVEIPMEYLSERDPQHLEFLREWNVDYVFASYTLDANHMQTIANNLKGTSTKVGGKPETWTGIHNLDKIMKKSGIMMVPRGDLGIEIGVMNVPEWQKKMILMCNKTGVPVVVATQMLESMMTSKEPKRAEVSDIFNAYLDGTDVVMLSGETSVGQYPVETVQMMNSILEMAEKYMFDPKNNINLGKRLEHYLKPSKNRADNISHSAYNAALRDLSIKSIIVPTISGYTARMLSRFRMNTRIIAFTNNKATYSQLGASWGVTSVYINEPYERLQRNVVDIARRYGWVKRGENIIVTQGLKPNSDQASGMYIQKVK